MIALVRAELLKIRTTNSWWLFGIGMIVMTGLALLINCVQADFLLNNAANDTTGVDEGTQQMLAAQSSVVAQAANIFTSGQYFGGLFVLMLGMLVVTNEFYHQTATATFLTTPHRTAVMIAKVITGIAFAALFWLITTVISLPTGILFFQGQNLSNGLGEWEVQRAIVFNLLVFMLWGILGVGLGALIRNQIGATLTGAALYLVGTFAGQIVFLLIHEYVIKENWVLAAQVIMPAAAAQVFVSAADPFQYAPDYWVGGLVLLAYGVVGGTIGTLILRRRDVS